MCINMEELRNYFHHEITNDNFENQFRQHICIINFVFNVDNEIFKYNITQEFENANIPRNIYGTYAIFCRENNCLYAWKGAPIIRRLKDHNNSAFNRGPANERAEYHNLFNNYTKGEILNAKIFRCDNAPNRIILKHFLKCIYQPEFWND